MDNLILEMQQVISEVKVNLLMCSDHAMRLLRLIWHRPQMTTFIGAVDLFHARGKLKESSSKALTFPAKLGRQLLSGCGTTFLYSKDLDF